MRLNLLFLDNYRDSCEIADCGVVLRVNFHDFVGYGNAERDFFNRAKVDTLGFCRVFRDPDWVSSSIL